MEREEYRLTEKRTREVLTDLEVKKKSRLQEKQEREVLTYCLVMEIKEYKLSKSLLTYW